MKNQNRFLPWAVCAVAAPVLLFTALAGAQTRPAPPAPAARPAAPAPSPASPVQNEREVAATQIELIRLLRLSPTLTTVVSHDPSLLANQDYVNRNNPQLAQFLASHPEVARNPEFYLFTHLHPGDGSPDEALQRAVWPELVQPRQEPPAYQDFLMGSLALAAFACFLGAFIWLIRVFFENRRWGRIFKLQSEVHGKLIDKFGTNQELALYMETEAGKRFLEAAPIPVGFEPEQRVPNALARVLTPLQIGIVLTLVGVGFFLIRVAGVHSMSDYKMQTPLLVLGTLALMPGLGFIISAGVTWLLATRLGLMPEPPKAANRNHPPFDSTDAQ